MTSFLCRIEELDVSGAKGVTLGQGRDALEIVVVRDGAHVRAYENRCPHRAMPLETVPDRFLDETGAHLVCTTHGARFAVADGRCVSGPCKGDRLGTIDIEVRALEVHLAAAGAREPTLQSDPASGTSQRTGG